MLPGWCPSVLHTRVVSVSVTYPGSGPPSVLYPGSGPPSVLYPGGLSPCVHTRVVIPVCTYPDVYLRLWEKPARYTSVFGRNPGVIPALGSVKR